MTTPNTTQSAALPPCRCPKDCPRHGKASIRPNWLDAFAAHDKAIADASAARDAGQEHAIAMEQSSNTARSIHKQVTRVSDLQRKFGVGYTSALKLVVAFDETTRRLAEAEATIAELLAALRDLYSMGAHQRTYGDNSDHKMVGNAYAKARAAIARAEAGRGAE